MYIRAMQISPFFRKAASGTLTIAKVGLILAAVAAVPQCTAENDYDVWDRRAWDSWYNNTVKNVKWGGNKAMDALETVGGRLLPRP